MEDTCNQKGRVSRTLAVYELLLLGGPCKQPQLLSPPVWNLRGGGGKMGPHYSTETL